MFEETDFITPSTHLPSSCYYILQISYWGWYPVILLCTFRNTRKNTNALCKKVPVLTYKLTGKYAFGYIEQSKPGTENIIKVMLKALGLGRGIITQNKKDAMRASYKVDPNKAKETARKQYNNNPEPQKAASHDQCRTHSETIKEDARKQYKTKPEPKRRAARKQYKTNPERKRRTARKQYRINPEPKRRTARKQYRINPEPKMRSARKQ